MNSQRALSTLHRLGQIVNTASNAASALSSLTRRTQSYHFTVGSGITFYLHVAHAEVRLYRHDTHQIEVTAHLHAPFAWRIATDQDEAGVYMVARRRPVISGMAYALFEILLPRDAHLALKLERVRLTFDHAAGWWEIPAPKL